MLIKLQEIRGFDFNPYGKFLSIPGKGKPTLDTGYSECWSDEYTLPMGEMRFGFEQVRFRRRVEITKMEQHRESKEVVICGNSPVVISLCLPRNKKDRLEKPHVEDIVSLVLRPGDVIVLDEFIWHTGCMPLSDDTFYLFSYRVRDEEIYWVPIEHGSIELDFGRNGC